MQQTSPVPSSIKWDYAYFQRPMKRTLGKLLAVLRIPSNVPLPSRPLPPTARHLVLRPTDKHLLGRSPKQPLVCLCIFGLAENSAKSELFLLYTMSKFSSQLTSIYFSTSCSFVREKAKARRNYVTCPGPSRSLQTEELVFDTGPISFQRQKSCR